jgi:hypothetical protein
MRTKEFYEEFWKETPHLLFLEGERKFIWTWREWTYVPLLPASKKYDMKNIPLNSC